MNDSVVEISRGQVVGFLRRGLVLAITTSLVLAAALYFWSDREEPAFRAEAALVAQSPHIDLRTLGLPEINFSPLHVDAYSVAVSSSPLLQAALSSAGMPATEKAVDALRSDLRVRALSVPQLLYITVTASSPERAADLANAITEQLQVWDTNRLTTELQRVAQLLSQRIAVQRLLLQDLESDASSNAQVAATQQVLAGLTSQLDSIVSLSTNATSTLKVLQAATPPTSSIGRSSLMFALLGLILGFLLAYGFMFVLELFNGRLYTSEGVERATGLPVVADLPRHRRGASISGDVAVTLLANLRSTIRLPLPATILVTSVSAKDDTATAAVALAESFARYGRNTLLVDADLRSPAIARRYRVPAKNKLHLTSCALGQQGSRAPLRVHVGSKAWLDLMYDDEPSPEDATSVLNGLSACLERWKAEYDVIVIRTAPVSRSSESLVISESCDAVILAVDPRTTVRRRLVGAVARLRRHGLPLAAALTTCGTSQFSARQEYRLEYPSDIVAIAPRTRTEPPNPI